MLKLFRRIRRKLLDEGSMRKYLVYAIGETLLVVIGILIALQLNNWNAKKQNDKTFESLVVALEQDLLNNIDEANRSLAEAYHKDSLVNLVLQKEATREAYRNDIYLDRLITSSFTYEVKDANVLSFLAKEDQFPRKYQPILPALKNYKEKIDLYRSYEEIGRQQYVEDYNYFVDNLPWFRKPDSLSREQAMDHFLSDPFYWGKVYRYKTNQLNGKAYVITILRNLAIGSYVSLRQIKGEYTRRELEKFLSEKGMQPFEQLACSFSRLSKTSSSRRRVSFRISSLIYNTRKEPVSLFLTANFGRGIIENKFDPSTIASSKWGWYGYEDSVIEWRDAENNCIGKFRTSTDGYLIID